ncbi:CPCC family cysteine-rich protein [Glycomyces tenuis]|uniref:CPCC family cysteine-rich protein n=1 Tax=Glycomyces tenuis TaxID=58116 RepID=UPI00047CC8E9|nr:CPCC family cysteine-rich protein [Glycomyces tenuis]
MKTWIPGKYPCPCCGRLVHDAPGAFEICPACFWEDDPVQLRWPRYRGGANEPSLIEAQRNFRVFNASEERAAHLTRPPADNEPLDPGFRPADPQVDRFESPDDPVSEWPSSRTSLYWWRPTYWRR